MLISHRVGKQIVFIKSFSFAIKFIVPGTLTIFVKLIFWKQLFQSTVSEKNNLDLALHNSESYHLIKNRILNFVSQTLQSVSSNATLSCVQVPSSTQS